MTTKTSFLCCKTTANNSRPESDMSVLNGGGGRLFGLHSSSYYKYRPGL